MASKPFPKPKLTDASLRKHDLVRQELLDFNASIDPAYEPRFVPRGSTKPPKEAWVNTVTPAASNGERNRVARASIETERSLMAAERFAELAHSAESEWTHQLKEQIFKPFTRTGTLLDIDPVLEWRIATDLYWNEFSKDRDENPDLIEQRLTGPKPDLTYGFPVYRSLENLPARLKNFGRAHRLSFDFLRDVCDDAKRGLINTPTTGLKTAKRAQDLHDRHLLCYPWAVVEVKHAKVPERDVTFCYRQAANAAAAALKIQESLYRESHPDLLYKKAVGIPPVATFTCVGPELRFWLAYRDYTAKTRRVDMKCIYVTNLTWPWGVMSARLIVENLRRWACTSLRSQILNCFDLIYPANDDLEEHHDMDRLFNQSNIHGNQYRQTSEDSPTDKTSERRSGSSRHKTKSKLQRPLVKRARRSEPAQKTASIDNDNSCLSDSSHGHKKRSNAKFKRRDTVPTVSMNNLNDKTSELSDDHHINYETSGRTRKGASEDPLVASHGELVHRPKHGQVQDWAGLRDESSKTHRLHHSDSECDSSDWDGSASHDVEDSGDENSYDDSDGQDSDTTTSVSDSAGGTDSGSIESDSSSDVASSCASEEPVTTPSPRKAATAEDVPNLRRRALEALEGSVMATLPTFKSILDGCSDIQIVWAIENCLFGGQLPESDFKLQNQWKRPSWDSVHMESLNKVVLDLNGATRTRKRITMSGHRGQPNLIDEALWQLFNADKSSELRRILVNLLSCHSGRDILRVLKEEQVTIEKVEWVTMEEEAFDLIDDASPAFYRRWNKNMQGDHV